MSQMKSNSSGITTSEWNNLQEIENREKGSIEREQVEVENQDNDKEMDETIIVKIQNLLNAESNSKFNETMKDSPIDNLSKPALHDNLGREGEHFKAQKLKENYEKLKKGTEENEELNSKVTPEPLEGVALEVKEIKPNYVSNVKSLSSDQVSTTLPDQL